MGKRVVVIDYGLGNLFSIKRALSYVGAHVDVTSSGRDVLRAEVVVLPGVGAFGDGMHQLRERGLVEPILQFAQSGRPVLGICLGMQLLFSEGEEFGLHEGLNLIEGKVARLCESDPDGRRVKVPHVGWSELVSAESRKDWGNTILKGLSEGEAMYFVHSYVPFPKDQDVSIAQIEYGGCWYCAVVQKENLIGCQFHPEKSGKAGLHLLRNLIESHV